MTQQRSQYSLPSELKRLDVAAEFKFTGKTGHFEGYASIFGNVDLGGDVILPGAFEELVTTRDGKVLILWQHDQHQPIGKALVTQDKQGLHVAGDLVLDDATANRAYALMKSGVLDGMSIGYDVLPGGAETVQGRRELRRLKLWEVSVVTFGMNPEARVETVKSALECTDPRELEQLLRKSALFPSRQQAKRAAAVLWPTLRGERDVHTDGDRDDRTPPEQKAKLEALRRELRTLHLSFEGK